jgi:hypothetical protein
MDRCCGPSAVTFSPSAARNIFRSLPCPSRRSHTIDVSSGSVLKVKSIDGTRNVASSCAFALKPSNRYCRNGSSYFTGSVVALKTSLKSMEAGVVSASIAGQRGWSMMGTLVICRVAVVPSWLKVSPSVGTGVTQYSPSGEIGG